MSINVSNLSMTKVIEFLEKCFTNITNLNQHTATSEIDGVETNISCDCEPISIDFKDITMDFNETAIELPEIELGLAS